MIGPVTLGLAVAAASSNRARFSPLALGGLTVCVVVAPFPVAAAALLAWAIARFRDAAAVTRRDRMAQDGAVEAAELVALGLAGGLSVAAAHHLALEHAPDDVRPALLRLTESMNAVGVIAALDSDRSHMRGVSDALTTAAASGSPALPALEAHVRHEHHRAHSAAVEVARRLPIRLLLPLTLVVLPGFVLITVGPTVIDSLARLTP